ncbi:unnamed protein product [Candidula unifasciata]|uniref:THD domain-containing protein n=1 Tax=Candidula unifasciata TaxID=100452 RepID=A0A8S3Z6J1_9EUPU|nr:unnamed protein product [Candidula unifasciata]
MPSNTDPTSSRSVKREACILGSTALALLINLVAIILGVYLMASLRPDANSQLLTSHGPDDHLGTIACINCDHELGNPLLKTLARKDSGTERLCCAESTSQMSAIMELMLQRPQGKQPHRKRQHLRESTSDAIKADDLSFSTASAHKRLLPREPFDSSKNHVPIFKNYTVPLNLNASHHDPLTEHARNVSVLESGFLISQAGTYLVYSNVRFKPDSSQPCSSFRFRVWEHKVVKTSTDQMKHDILKSVHTCCDSCTRDRETSFAGGAFILNQGEHLSVEISGLGLISYHPQSSYFGLMMLGSSELA